MPTPGKIWADKKQEKRNMSQAEKAGNFAALHVPGNPVILYNVWDAGSANAVVAAGAKAVATGSASVAGAFGYQDEEQLPLDDVFRTARRIVATVDVPVTIDFEGGYATDPENLSRNFTTLLSCGAIGCNFEDQIVGGSGLYEPDVQAARIKALRSAADAAGIPAFINARTDIFLKAAAPDHNATMLDAALHRARHYADAGASGFFLPGLVDEKLIERACAASPLPVNIMMLKTSPSKARQAELGVARISHGPGPWRLAMRAFAEGAAAAFA
jgi:2-methylisocitrate lyase-like PEP mutase family enzyme